jgi:hypothetical protein
MFFGSVDYGRLKLIFLGSVDYRRLQPPANERDAEIAQILGSVDSKGT